MEVSKARRLVELEKGGDKVLLTLWEGNKITTCSTVEDKKQACESCQGDDELCDSYINFLQERGYQATEIELGEGADLGLPRFLDERVIAVNPVVKYEPESSEESLSTAD